MTEWTPSERLAALGLSGRDFAVASAQVDRTVYTKLAGTGGAQRRVWGDRDEAVLILLEHLGADGAAAAVTAIRERKAGKEC